MEIKKKNGLVAGLTDIKDIRQELNMWTGEIVNYSTVEGTPVQVSTFSHQALDVIGARIESDLLQQGRLQVSLRFQFPTAEWSYFGTNYTHATQHRSEIQSQNPPGALFLHQLDTTRYYVTIK